MSRAVRLAEHQAGMISRRQLRACGISTARISRLAAGAHLIAVHPAVFAVGHRPSTIEARLWAARLHGGDGATLSHSTAAWWWQMIKSQPRVIHLSVRGRPAPVPGIRIHRPRSLEAVEHLAMLVTRPDRTLLDLAAMLRERDLRVALAGAEYRNLVDLNRLSDQLRRGRPGAAALRRAIERHLPALARAESELEIEFLLLCERAGLPMPEVQAKLGRHRVDCLWRGRSVVIELDGRQAHARELAFERDRRRDLELRAMGFTVIRYTWHQVRDDPRTVVADVLRALGRPSRH